MRAMSGRLSVVRKECAKRVIYTSPSLLVTALVVMMNNVTLMCTSQVHRVNPD